MTHPWYVPYLRRRVFLGLDYSQLEIRFLAQVSRDEHLVKLFNTKEDIHCTVGHAITGWPIQVIKEDDQKRRLVKNIHFGMVYGLTPDSMYDFVVAKGVKTTPREVARLHRAYFKQFPGVRRYIEWCHKTTKKTGVAETLFRFPIPIDTSEKNRSAGASFWKNQAVNYRIQSGAHNLMLLAFALMKRRMSEYRLILPPCMEIHDALYLAPRLRKLITAYRLAKRLLEDDVVVAVRKDFGIDWVIPLEVEAKAGFRFGVMVKYSGEPVSQFLESWCWANRAQDAKLHVELADVEREQPENSIL